MERQFSLAHLTAIHCDLPELIYTANIAGYDNVSLRTIPLSANSDCNYPLATSPKRLQETKKALSETGIKLHDIELARITDNLDVKESFQPELEIAAELGAHSIICSVWTEDKNYATDQFASLCELARSVDLKVSLEFVSISAMRSLDEALTLLKTVNQENAGLLLDMFYLHITQVPAIALKDIPPQLIHFLHLCDGPQLMPSDDDTLCQLIREKRSYIGQGGIPIAEYLRALPEVVCSLELPHLENTQKYGHAEHARRCLQSAKNYIEDNNL